MGMFPLSKKHVRVAWIGVFAIGATFDLRAGEAKLSGLQFGIGLPMESPAARVSVSEVVQGAQKRGFLRISVLPLVVANGVQIRFSRPDVAALLDIRATLRSLVKLDAQELRRVEFFVGAEAHPRLLAEAVVPGVDSWEFKGVSFLGRVRSEELSECKLMLTGSQAGVFLLKSAAGDRQVLLLDLLAPREAN